MLGALGTAGRGLVGVIAGQASAIALVAVAVGVPVGIVVGRAVWRSIVDTYSFLDVAPPAALLAALIVPAALALANATALAPGWMARRVRIAAELRAE